MTTTHITPRSFTEPKLRFKPSMQNLSSASAHNFANYRHSRRYSLPNAINPLQGLYVRNNTSEVQVISELWKYDKVLIKVIPDLECKCCKLELEQLGYLKDLFWELKVKLVAITLNEVNESYLSNSLKSFYYYRDVDENVFKTLNLLNKSTSSIGLSFLKKVRSISNKIKHSHQTNSNNSNLKHAGSKLKVLKHKHTVATLIIDHNSNILYQSKKCESDASSILEFYKISGGDPKDLEHLIYNDEYGIYNYISASSSISSNI